MFIYCDLLREKFCNSIPVYCTRLFQMETEDRDICDPDTVFSNLNITWYAKSRITKSIPGLYSKIVLKQLSILAIFKQTFWIVNKKNVSIVWILLSITYLSNLANLVRLAASSIIPNLTLVEYSFQKSIYLSLSIFLIISRHFLTSFFLITFSNLCCCKFSLDTFNGRSSKIVKIVN